MASGEPLNQNSPLVELTGLVLSYIILKAETADFVIRQSKLFGTTIEVGDRTFNSKDESKVIEQLLRYLIEKEVTMTKEDFDKVELDEEEPEDIVALAEEFAEGGMSEFGQVIEAARAERFSIIQKALSECDLTGPVVKLDEIINEVRAKTQLEDLDLKELTECIRHVGLDNLLGGSPLAI